MVIFIGSKVFMIQIEIEIRIEIRIEIYNTIEIRIKICLVGLIMWKNGCVFRNLIVLGINIRGCLQRG